MINIGSYQREYIITNRLGTYSSANYLYGNTRKYHSLMASTQGHLNRINVLNRLIERIETNQSEFQLSSNLYENYHIDPEGFRNISNFTYTPYPKWKFNIPATSIEKELMLHQNEDTLLLKYSINSSSAGKLIISPLINIREIHELGNKQQFENYRIIVLNNYANVTSDQNLSLHFASDKSRFIKQPDIYFRMFYPDEEMRGYEAYEDLFLPGFFEVNFQPGETTHFLAFKFNEKPELNIEDVWNENYLELDLGNYSFENELMNQKEKFLVNHPKHSGIVAGHHWFDEWARDTFISLHGLSLSNSNFQFAKTVINEWGKNFHNGMLPNRLFINKVMNSVDGMFWYAIRLYEYSEMSKEYNTAESLLPQLENIYTNISEGKNNLSITTDGFLFDSSITEARTWMDAIVDGKPVIDRSGCAVEIQALWYNFIRILIIFKEKFNDRTHLKQLKELKINLEKKFENTFWNNSAKCLYDVIKLREIDKSIRPNQIIPLYLPFKLLSSRRSKMILATLEQKLLTDVGLRTLSREDNKFQSDYSGDQKERDLAYHQGTIWPYLLGMYLIAYLKTYNHSISSRNYVSQKLKSLENELKIKNLIYLPEIFSAESIEPNGCLTQAWSVATILETFYYLKLN